MREDIGEELVSRRIEPFVDPVIPKEGDLQSEQRRQRVVSGLRLLTRTTEARRQRKLLRFTGATAALAAAAAFTLWFRPQEPMVQPQVELPRLTLSVHGSEAEVASASGVARVPAGKPAQIRELQRISTESDSTARVQVGGRAPGAGIELEVRPQSEITIAHQSTVAELEQLHLTRGSVRVEVRQLPEGGTFMVITPSIRAVVIGTAFTVEVSDDKRDSCVRVSEGIVRLEKTQEPHTEIARVGAGESWGCEDRQAESLAPKPADASSGSPQRRKPTTAQPRISTPKSTLAEESALYASAVRHNQEQDYAAAGRDLDQLLRKYPNSALAGEAARLRSKMREAAETTRAEQP